MYTEEQINAFLEANNDSSGDPGAVIRMAKAIILELMTVNGNLKNVNADYHQRIGEMETARALAEGKLG